jgi:monovalent cation:proton antiporter-2 (CPA2) family protein
MVTLETRRPCLELRVESHTIPHLHEIAIFLVAAGIIVPLLHRSRVSPVLGYLFIGAIVGPFGLGLLVDTLPWLRYFVISDLAGVQSLAELGVIFLLFMIGLELSFDRLWDMRRLVFGLGSLQVLITAVAIGMIAWGFGNTPAASMVLGCCLALSSTAIVMQILMDRRQLASPLGRSSFSILLMQDLAVVPILFLVGVLGSQSQDSIGMAFLGSLLKAAAVIGGIYFGGRLLLRPLFHMAARARSAEMFMAATLLVIIGAASITGVSGLSMALGAFLAGVLLADTEFRHEIEVNIEPFKGLLLGLFFMSVGMGIDYRLVLDQWFWLLVSVLGLFTLKSLITAGLCLAFGIPRAVALEAGLLLGQGGEFAFVVVGLAAGLGLLPADVVQFMLIVTGLTMIVTPLIAWSGSRLAAMLDKPGRDDAGSGDLSEIADWQGHVLIAGFGRVGQLVARALDTEGQAWLALDARAMHVAVERAQCKQVYYGDASRLDLLRRAHADSASVMVLTMDNPEVMEEVVRVVKAEWPALPVVARARDVAHAQRLIKLGANDVIPEALEGSLQLAGRVLQQLGAPESAATRRVDALRENCLDIMNS